MDILVWPDNKLNTVSEKVEDLEEIKEYLPDFIRCVDDDGVAGLSAIQAGIPKRFFIMKLYNDEGYDMEIVINPYILKYSEEKIVQQEGCLSFPFISIPVERSKTIIVSYTSCNPDGTNKHFKELKLHDFNARCFQHEFDHLEGKTFFSALSPMKRDLYKRKYNKVRNRLKKVGRI